MYKEFKESLSDSLASANREIKRLALGAPITFIALVIFHISFAVTLIIHIDSFGKLILSFMGVVLALFPSYGMLKSSNDEF